MQIKEKLEVFRKFTIDVADKEIEALIQEYKENCDRELEEFRKSRQIELEHKFQIKETEIRRQVNRKVSEEMVRQKRILDSCKQEWKGKLIARVKELLEEYQQTESYQGFLAAKIRMAKEVAGDEPVVVYINPSDADKKQGLEQETGVELTVSSIDFGGGVRAVIRSRNILVDESFVTKLEQEETYL